MSATHIDLRAQLVGAIAGPKIPAVHTSRGGHLLVMTDDEVPSLGENAYLLVDTDGGMAIARLIHNKGPEKLRWTIFDAQLRAAVDRNSEPGTSYWAERWFSPVARDPSDRPTGQVKT